MFLCLIILLGFVLRVWQVGDIPTGLNRDEAGIGYNAYSILHTLKDEYGHLLPLSFESFGDWKLPLYIYSTSIALFFEPLSVFAVRLPSVLFGIFTILLTYVFVKSIFSEFVRKDTIALLSSFFLAISPWHIHFSRVASEANTAVFLVVLGLTLFSIGSRMVHLVASSLILSLSLYSYHGNHIFTPLVFAALCILLLTRKTPKKGTFVFIAVFLVSSFIIFNKTLFSADVTKIAGLTPLSDKYRVYEAVALPRGEHQVGQGNLLTKMFHNKTSFFFQSIMNGYVKGISTDFLFIKGGGNLQHNIPGIGNMYISDIVFLSIGLFLLFHSRLKWRWFLLYWFLISPIPASFTKDAPHSARMLAFLPLPFILISIGTKGIIEKARSFREKTAISFAVAIIFVLNLAVYLDLYHIHFPVNSEIAWGGGFEELVRDISVLSPRYREIIMDRPDYSPYIYFLFYGKVNPERYQQEVVRYPRTEEGFHHVASFENLSFRKVEYAEDMLRPGSLVIAWADSAPSSATHSATKVTTLQLQKLQDRYETTFGLSKGDIVQNKLIKTIRLRNGSPRFYLIEINKISSYE